MISKVDISQKYEHELCSTIIIGLPEIIVMPDVKW